MKKILIFWMAILTGIASAYAQSGSCGDNLTWTLENGTLTISGTGAMPKAPWCNYNTSVITVVITEGVTSVEMNAFYYKVSK